MAAKPLPPRPLADLIDACLGPALAAQGFAASDVIASWPEIVGERLAAFSQPVKLEWPRRTRGAAPEERAPATLVVRVEGAFALEMQHLAPLVMERVNARYGWRCVGKVVLKQGPVRRLPKAAPRPRPLDEATLGAIQAATAGVGDQGLRAALDRLGRAVAASRTKP
ncbi:MAG TPA: DciA family protein [Salinarimonas sp.]|jgi:hypothetical protein|nr:DciA family protein [Salinarimonas sp.]